MAPTRFRVRELAEAQGLNISQLWQKAIRDTPNHSMAYNTIADLWHNRTKRPSLDTLNAVATALGVEPGDLITNDPQPDAAAEPERQRKKKGLSSDFRYPGWAMQKQAA